MTFCLRWSVSYVPTRFFLFFVMLFSTSALSLTLEELRQEILKHPDIRWTAADSGKIEALGIHGRSSPFGMLSQEIDDGLEVLPDESFFRDDDPELPSYWDWRNKDGKNWMTPIRNQAYCGSCVAFAALGAMEGQININHKVPNLSLDLSEQYLFSSIGGCDSGAMPVFAIISLESNGTPDESCFPYASGRLGENQSNSLACPDVKSRVYRLKEPLSFSGFNVRKALLDGPLMTTMTVYEDFMFYKEGIYQYVTGVKLGGHAVTLVGYDDANDAWIVRNSWGQDWGEDGYFRIKRNDPSGVGRSGDRMMIDGLEKIVKLTSPDYFDAIAGVSHFSFSNYSGEELSSLSLTFRKEGDPNSTKIFPVPPPFDSYRFDTATLSDGVYAISLSGQLASGGTTSKPWFSRVIIMNQPPPPVTMTLVPDFAVGQPVSKRVYFTVKAEGATIPLTAADFKFRKTDGSFEKKVIAQDPGKATKVGWRTNSFPNGEYEVFTVGYIGNLAHYESEHLFINVKN